jgi:hypothetical protein
MFFIANIRIETTLTLLKPWTLAPWEVVGIMHLYKHILSSS